MSRPNTPRILSPNEIIAALAEERLKGREKARKEEAQAIAASEGMASGLNKDSDSAIRQITSKGGRDALDDFDFNIPRISTQPEVVVPRITAKLPDSIGPISEKVAEAAKEAVVVTPTLFIGTYQDPNDVEKERDAIVPAPVDSSETDLTDQAHGEGEDEPAPITLRYGPKPAVADAAPAESPIAAVIGGERVEAPVAAVYVPEVTNETIVKPLEEEFEVLTFDEPEIQGASEEDEDLKNFMERSPDSVNNSKKAIREFLADLGIKESVKRENDEFERMHTFKVGALVQPIVSVFNKVKSIFRSKAENYALNMEVKIKSELAALDQDYKKDLADIDDKYTAISEYIGLEFGKAINFDATNEQEIRMFVDKCKYASLSPEYSAVNKLMEASKVKRDERYKKEKAELEKIMSEGQTSVENGVKVPKTPWYSDFASDLRSVFSKKPVLVDKEEEVRRDVTVLTDLTKLKKEQRAKKTGFMAALAATAGLLATGLGVTNYFSKPKMDVSNEPVASVAAVNEKPIWDRVHALEYKAVSKTEVKPVVKAYSAPKYVAKPIVKPVQKTVEVSDQLTMADKNMAIANAEGKTRAFRDKVEMILGTDFLPSIQQENRLNGLINQIMPQAKSLNSKVDLKKLNDTFSSIEADLAQLEKERTALFAPKYIASAEINSRLAADQMKTIKSLTANRGHKFTIHHVVAKTKDSRTVGDVSIPYSVDLDQIEAKVNKIMTRVRTPNSRVLTEAQAKADAADAKYWLDYLKFVDWHVKYGENARTITFNK